MSRFDFKKFSLSDDNTPMKIGMDSVILGAWSSVPVQGRALDIGTGCGLLAFMLARRSPRLSITGVEIYKPAYNDAVENLKNFSLPHNINFVNADIRAWNDNRGFDLVITNPPYFKGDLKPGDGGRSLARFQDGLPLDLLVEKVSKLLKPSGRFSIIIPAGQAFEMNRTCVSSGLILQRKLNVRHRIDLPVKRILLEFGYENPHKIVDEELVIEDASGEYTSEYKRLTRDFYLAF
jgi:tRNA1Val (adenine37-N6)-methyltransferase